MFKKSKKSDSFRITDSPNQYNDRIAALNALGDNQAQKVNTQTMNRISKNKTVLSSNSTNGNTTLPGTTS
jgi:hypothetical protein